MKFKKCKICGKVHKSTVIKKMAKKLGFKVYDMSVKVEPTDYKGLPTKRR